MSGSPPLSLVNHSEGVVGDAQVAQALAEGADGAVHRNDLGVVRP